MNENSFENRYEDYMRISPRSKFIDMLHYLLNDDVVTKWALNYGFSKWSWDIEKDLREEGTWNDI